MATKLKRKIKSYFTHIWVIEICIIVAISIFFGVEVFKDVFTTYKSSALTAMEATLNPKEYYKGAFLEEVRGLQKYIYANTNGLEEILDNDKNREEILKSYFINNINDSSKDRLYFIIKDKRDGSFITNDFSEELSGKDVDKYIESWYSGYKFIRVFDNNNMSEEGVKYDSDILSNFEEYYYSDIDRYTDIKIEQRAFIMFIFVITVVLLIMKVIYVLLTAKDETLLRGNFIKSVIFVIRYGFNYKSTRRALLLSIVSISLFYAGYLYSLAISGGYENNILSRFFLLYPFKGTFVLMLLPMIGVFYALKKSIEVMKVNESLNGYEEGNNKILVKYDGSVEIKELIENLEKIRVNYEHVVSDALKNEKLKTELITNVSHDLRTPLTSIINYINILKGDITEDEREEYLEIVDTKSKKLKVLIDDLFEMSKINSGKMEIYKEKINIVSLIYQTIGEYYYLYEENNLDIKVDSFKDEIFLEVDGKLISRSIENIIINAIKYSLPKTRVYVNIEEDEQYISIAVKNISNYEMKFNHNEIFERFARGDISRNSSIEGSGLGLAITKSIVELHNGKINVNKEGDMFKIYIFLPKIKGEQ